MKHSTRILLAVGFLALSMLGGLIATILRPDRVEAASPGFGPSVAITAFKAPLVGQYSVYIDGGSAKKLGDIGQFTVQNSGSVVEATYQGRLYVGSFFQGNHLLFQLRVDDTAPLENTGLGLVTEIQADSHVLSTFSGYWQNLPAGNHTVSMWVYAPVGWTTFATEVYINPGNYENSEAIVKEYLPSLSIPGH